jgi:molecular chaperone GrpE
MVEMTQFTRGRDWRTRLAHWLGLYPVPADVAGEVAALRAAVAALQATAAGLTQAQVDSQATIAGQRETIDRLERQIGRSGKEQFKANALAEAQQQTVKSLLEQLRDAESYRERELASLRERLTFARRDGRMEIIQRLLPVADGLGEAVAAGERLLTNERIGGSADQRISEWANQRMGESVNERIEEAAVPFGTRLGRAWAKLWGRPRPIVLAEVANTEGSQLAADTSSTEAQAAWLEGLKLVQERLLDVLAAEGVRPIEVEGDPFDPHLHVAVETVPATDTTAPGTIVRELRRGYLTGETVVRYAEVVVAR